MMSLVSVLRYPPWPFVAGSVSNCRVLFLLFALRIFYLMTLTRGVSASAQTYVLAGVRPTGLLCRMPIKAWTTQQRGRYFTFSEGTLRTRLEVPAALRDDFLALVREIVEWRLAQYLERRQDG